MTIHILDERGPTPERLEKAAGDFVVGGDERTKRIYHFRDTPLYRLYKRLGIEDKSQAAQEQLMKEYMALTRYRDHWHGAHLEGCVKSIDLDRVQSSGGGEGASDAYVRHLHAYRRMVKVIGMWHSQVVEHIACWERPIDDCSAFGLAISPPTFRKMLRHAASLLVDA